MTSSEKFGRLRVVAHSKGGARPGHRAGMVGREDTLAAIRERVTASEAGDGTLTFLVGEPGIGKTRLAEEAASYAERCGMGVFWGRCYDTEGVIPYRPWAQIIRQYAATIPGDSVSRLGGVVGRDIARVVPELGDELTRADPGPQAPADRIRLFDSVTGFFHEAARSGPLLLVLEDLHWADQSTILLLQHLSRRLAGVRIALIATYREADLGAEHPLTPVLAGIWERRAAERFRLEGLDERATRLLVAGLAHEPESAVSPAFARSVRARTDGNPFFIEEVLRQMRESGESPGEAALTEFSAAWVESHGVPEGVRDVIGQRLSSLPRETVSVLSSAAVLGRRFAFDILVATAAQAETEVVEAVERALERRLIVDRPTRPGSYEFVHALVQETLLARLAGPRRQKMHLAVAAALETVHAGGKDRYVGQLAEHYRAAGPAAPLEK